MMKTSKIIIVCFLVGLSNVGYGQWVTSDPIHTGVTTLIKLFQDPSFKTMVKNIEKLQKVSSAVQQVKQGKEIITSISKSVSTISALATAASKDGHIYPLEFQYMTKDLDNIAKVGTSILADMKTGLAGSGNVLKMSDAERASWIREVHKRVLAYEDGIQFYFRNIEKRSFGRTQNKADVKNTSALYSLVADASNNPMFNYDAAITGTGYDATYDNTDKSVLDSVRASKEERDLRDQCQIDYDNYFAALQIEEAKNEGAAFLALIQQGYMWESKDSNFWQNTFTPSSSIKKEGDTFESYVSGGSSEVSFSEAYKGFKDPSGKRISNQEMELKVKILASGNLLQIRQKLKAEYNLSKCDGLN